MALRCAQFYSLLAAMGIIEFGSAIGNVIGDQSCVTPAADNSPVLLGESCASLLQRRQVTMNGPKRTFLSETFGEDLIYPDMVDATCSLGKGCTAGGSTPRVRGACVQGADTTLPRQCWDVCNNEHAAEDYRLVAPLDAIVRKIRSGEFEHMKCPTASASSGGSILGTAEQTSGATGGATGGIATIAKFAPGAFGSIAAGLYGTLAVNEIGEGIEIEGVLNGLEASTAGGLHIHHNSACDDSGGHYFDGLYADPWLYSKWTSDEVGRAMVRLEVGNFTLNGTPRPVFGRVIVVHASNGTKVGCGRIVSASIVGTSSPEVIDLEGTSTADKAINRTTVGEGRLNASTNVSKLPRPIIEGVTVPVLSPWGKQVPIQRDTNLSTDITRPNVFRDDNATTKVDTDETIEQNRSEKNNNVNGENAAKEANISRTDQEEIEEQNQNTGLDGNEDLVRGNGSEVETNEDNDSINYDNDEVDQDNGNVNNKDSDLYRGVIYRDRIDPTCRPGRGCSDGIGFNPKGRGTCVVVVINSERRWQHECWDVCNFAHDPHEYGLHVEEDVQAVRKGDFAPQMACPQSRPARD